jgi:pyridoxamine 5'-phosphate oxidase family protein
MRFTEEELAYLRSQPLARVATLGDDEQPDVVPLAFEFDGTYFWVGGSGPTVAGTRKFRNIEAGHRKVAMVIDDHLLESVIPGTRQPEPSTRSRPSVIPRWRRG